MIVAHMAEGVSVRLEAMRRKQLPGDVPTVGIQAMATYYTGGLLHLIKWWLVNDKPCTKQELIEQTMLLANFPEDFK